MAAKPIRKLVVKTGEYIDNLTGKNKARWLQVGVLFKHDDGNLSIKLEAMPIAKDFDGWVSVFPIDEQQPAQPQAQQPARSQHNGGYQQPAYQPTHQPPQASDDIPF